MKLFFDITVEDSDENTPDSVRVNINNLTKKGNIELTPIVTNQNNEHQCSSTAPMTMEFFRSDLKNKSGVQHKIFRRVQNIFKR